MSTWALTRRLAGECLKFPGRMLAVGLSVVALGLTQLYLTWLVKQWADGPLASGDTAQMTGLLARGALATVVAAAALVVSRYVLDGICLRVIEDLRNRAIARILSWDLAAARRFPAGDLLARFLSDVTQVAGLVVNVVRRVMHEAIVAAGALIMLFVLDWRLALVTSLVAPVAVVLLVRFGGAIRRWGAEAQAETGRLGAILDEQLHGLTTIKNYQTEAFERGRFAVINATVRASLLRSALWSAALIGSVFLSTALSLMLLAGYGTLQLSNEALPAGSLLAFCLYAGQAVEPIRRLSEAHGLLQAGLGAAARVYELIDLPAGERSSGARLEAARGAVDLESVSFAYVTEVPVLSDVSLRLQAGEQVALVGASGAGKSTLAALVAAFHTPQRGQIRVDGIDIEGLRLTDLRRAVCVVEQEPFIFSGSLEDNIRYGRWDAPAATVARAASLAGLDPLLSALPRGLRTTVSEAGRQLSGGEKQRLSLARAIVRGPAILILDEATSALDSEMEAAMFARLAPWLAERTVLAIAHRLSTISRFPRVVLLERGRIAADGPPEQLAVECPAFGALFAEQLQPLRVRC